MITSTTDNWASNEFSLPMKGCRPQMSATLAKGASLLAATPHVSFSQACGSSRKIVSTVLQDIRLAPTVMLASHRQATLQRIQQCATKDFVIPTDTVFFTMPGHKGCKGLRPLQGKVLGVAQHNVMVVEAATGIPLGVPVVHNWTRGGHQDHWEIESHKWYMGLTYANELAQSHPGGRYIVVNDREGDILELFKTPRLPGVELVGRVCQPRKYERVDTNQQEVGLEQVAYLEELAEQLPVRHLRQVDIYRDNRRVKLTLEVKACPVTIWPGDKKSVRLHAARGLNLVVAHEIAAVDDKGQDGYDAKSAVNWLLVTSLPVDTQLEIDFVLDCYTQRWLVERLHYTMKSGALNVTQLQFDDVGTLCNGLILSTVTAWQLLCLTLAARHPLLSAQHCLTKRQLLILELIAGHPLPSLQMACVSIGKLAGFEPSRAQPYPGVKKLSQGLNRLTAMEELHQLMQP